MASASRQTPARRLQQVPVNPAQQQADMNLEHLRIRDPTPPNNNRRGIRRKLNLDPSPEAARYLPVLEGPNAPKRAHLSTPKIGSSGSSRKNLLNLFNRLDITKKEKKVVDEKQAMIDEIDNLLDVGL